MPNFVPPNTKSWIRPWYEWKIYWVGRKTINISWILFSSYDCSESQLPLQLHFRPSLLNFPQIYHGWVLPTIIIICTTPHPSQTHPTPWHLQKNMHTWGEKQISSCTCLSVCVFEDFFQISYRSSLKLLWNLTFSTAFNDLAIVLPIFRLIKTKSFNLIEQRERTRFLITVWTSRKVDFNTVLWWYKFWTRGDATYLYFVWFVIFFKLCNN